MTTERRILFALFAIAFGIRILFAAIFGADVAENPGLITTESFYAEKIISSTEWIRTPYSPLAPGYPVFLGIIFLLTGGHIWPVIIVQAILGGLMSILVYILGTLISGWAAGLASAMWMALYAHHIRFTDIFSRDILGCFLFTLLVLVLCSPFRRMRSSLLAGGICALLIHVEPMFILLLPIFVLFIFFALTRHLFINVQYVFLFVSFIIILSLPWTVRNYFVYHQAVPVSLEATRYTSPVKHKVPKKIKTMIRSGSPHISKSRMSFMQYNAYEFWRVAKFGGTEEAAAEFTENQPAAHGWSMRHNVSSIITYGFLLPFFLVGLFLAFKQKNRNAIFISVLIVAYFLLRSFYGGGDRARLTVEPLIILLAFYGLAELVGSFRKERADA